MVGKSDRVTYMGSNNVAAVLRAATILLKMYSTFLTGKTSHKDVKDSTSWLFKAYYGNRMFMGYCYVACEVLYLTLFLIVDTQNESLVDVVVSSVQQGSLLSILVVVAVSLFQFFDLYEKLLTSCNYVTRRQSLKLLSELLLEPPNSHIMK